MSISSIMLRAAFKRSDDKRDKGLTTPEDVLRFDNIQYGANPKWNVLDVYRPKNTEGPLPVIVSVHGGGWVYGDKERYQYYCMSLAEQGFAVVNYSYRLAPKYKFPSSIEDTNSVFRWVLFNAEQYGFDFSDTDKKTLFSLDNPGKPHIANLMVKYGYAKSKEDAIENYINKHKSKEKSHFHIHIFTFYSHRNSQKSREKIYIYIYIYKYIYKYMVFCEHFHPKM